MKLIEQKATLIPQNVGLEGIYKHIELCGRTCYKSEDRITDISAPKFVEAMIKNKHHAMLEHGTIYLNYPLEGDTLFYLANPYTKMNRIKDKGYAVTTNLRVLVENDHMNDLQYLCSPLPEHEPRITIKFTTDKGVANELVRHRVFSFAQESTRYCNYSKDKFGNHLTFIIPSWSISIKPDVLIYSPFEITPKEAEFMQACFDSEKRYLSMLKSDATPQEARQVLPLALKTDICMTGFLSDWQHFFDLRLYGITGAPHPDMKALAELAMQEFKTIGLADKVTRSEEQITTLKAQAVETYKKYIG